MANILFFKNKLDPKKIFAIEHDGPLPDGGLQKLERILIAELLTDGSVQGTFVGARQEFPTQFSSKAVDISHTIGLPGVTRFELFKEDNSPTPEFDRMRQDVYQGLGQDIFQTSRQPGRTRNIEDIRAFNKEHGLALKEERIEFLERRAAENGRPWTDVELAAYAQINSEHCGHDKFKGIVILDGEQQPYSMMELIKQSAMDPNSSSGYRGKIVSAFDDNSAVFYPATVRKYVRGEDGRMMIEEVDIASIGKIESHNHPSAVEPFEGAATGVGGAYRDLFAPGLGGMADSTHMILFTNYPRVGDRANLPEKHLYQSGRQIVVGATNGAAGYANPAGIPLTNFRWFAGEHSENGKNWGYPKPIVLGGGAGHVHLEHAKKDDAKIKPGQRIVHIGGPNYRVGVGGGTASSLNSGTVSRDIDFASVQRGDPEMGNRVFRVIERAMAMGMENPFISLHDRGAGGNSTCISELVKSQGGFIDMSKLPVGDKTLSPLEVLINESQEVMMGIVKEGKDLKILKKAAKAEGCDLHDIGYITGDMNLVFQQADGSRPFEMGLNDIFHGASKHIMHDRKVTHTFKDVEYKPEDFVKNLHKVFAMPSVGSRDFMANKSDSSVGGRVIQSLRTGELQQTTDKVGIVKADFLSDLGTATTTGFSPMAALMDSALGARRSIADAVLPLALMPLDGGRQGISLSANWHAALGNEGETYRLYKAVEAASKHTRETDLTGIITGKDSLSMTQEVENEKIMAPQTLVITAFAPVKKLDKRVPTVMNTEKDSRFYHIDFSFDWEKLGGSAFAQSLGYVGKEAPDVTDIERFNRAFDAIQQAVQKGLILAGNSISGGGLITAITEMAFPNTKGGIKIELDGGDLSEQLFAENPGLVVQVEKDKIEEFEMVMAEFDTYADYLGRNINRRTLEISRASGGEKIRLDMDQLRESWMTSSNHVEKDQSNLAAERAENMMQQPLIIDTKGFKNVNVNLDKKRETTATVLRAPGTNSDRESAFAAEFVGGFSKAYIITMDELLSREATLKNTDLLILPGGFSYADVLGSAKGWAAIIQENPYAYDEVMGFSNRKGTQTLGICNGCQLVMELGLIGGKPAPMQHNDSGKFDSAMVSTVVPPNTSIMMQGLSGQTLIVPVAHGEGKFGLDGLVEGRDYQKVLRYAYSAYPGNPNGSKDDVAGIANKEGNIVAIMPHPERAVFPDRLSYGFDDPRMNLDHPSGYKVTPWVEMFAAANRYAKTR